jgi:peroxiredoxin
MTQLVPPVSSVAPDFTLDSTSGAAVTLSSYRGQQPVLLAFFPLAFTSVCTAELCSFTDNFDKFREHNVAVLPVSVDSVPTLKEYKAKHDMKTELLSDFKREVGKLYGVLLLDKFYDNRAYFLVDKEGVIRWEHVEERPSMRRDDEEILAQIAKLAK